MAAFVPGVAPGAFTSKCAAPEVSPRRPHAMRMAVNPEPPAYRLYLSQIPADRLNKAPMITINQIPGPSDAFNSVSVALCDFPRDESAGNSLKAGVDVDETLLGDAPAPEKYEKFFPRGTLHEAPLISLVDGGTELTRSMTIIQCEVPTSISNGKVLLKDGTPPSPELYRKFDNMNLNKAPAVQACFGTCEGDSAVAAPMAEVPLDYAGAAVLFKKYRG